MRVSQRILYFALCVLLSGTVYAQDFGFGFGDAEADSISRPLTVAVGGEVSASMLGYFDDFSSSMDRVTLGDIFSGSLVFSARSAFADAFINLNLTPAASPVSVDEAYVHAYFGSFDIAAGLRKITWGKADVMGPLDVINPLNTTELYTSMADNRDFMSVKIARPLVHASYRFGDFSKIEGVFVPGFAPHRLAETGEKWADSRMELLAIEEIEFGTGTILVTVMQPSTNNLSFAQGGIRFTTTIGSSDMGMQYYYGRLHEPSVGFTADLPAGVQVDIVYNPYHQIGFDYAQVLFGFNTRAELAANITGDAKGDDGSVYNPFIAWCFGFDRDIFGGINVNLQISQNIRMMHDKLGAGFDINNPMSFLFGDIEGGLRQTATRLTAAFSRTFFRDELELRTAVAWGMEDRDCAVMPALIWNKNDIRFALSGGFFAGNAGGQLGQYRNNNFFRVSMTYRF